MSLNNDGKSESHKNIPSEADACLLPQNHKKKKKQSHKEDVASCKLAVNTFENKSIMNIAKKGKKRKLSDTDDKNVETNKENNYAVSHKIPKVIKEVSKKQKSKKVKKKADTLSNEETCNEVDIKRDRDFHIPKIPDVESTECNHEEFSTSDRPCNENVKNEDEYTLIDEVKQMRRLKIDRVLPDWLANPVFISMNLADGMEVSEMRGLRPIFKKILKKRNIERFFPAQVAVIPELLASGNTLSMRYRPRDICISAPTGSGKTLAYVLPILQALSHRVVPQIRAVILLPTQELARQVHDVIAIFTKYLKLRVSLAVGGRSLKKERSTLIFKDTQGDCAADILVATPGKLSDHMNYTNKLNLKYLRYLVMDEADLFSSSSGGSFMVQVEKLLKTIPRAVPDNRIICGGFQPRDGVSMPEYYLQKILISATLMHDPEQLKVFDLYQPKLFAASNLSEVTNAVQTIGPYIRPEEVIEEYIKVDPNQKPLVLYHLISISKLKRVLVFTKSKRATHNLSVVLSALFEDLTVAEFSSNKANRRKILEEFYKKNIHVLVSSDAMARGIDIKGIQQVVSYDVPSLQTYVHRCGRTGRAGKVGYSLCMVEATDDSKRDFKPIRRTCKDQLNQIHVSEQDLLGYADKYQAALDILKETIQEEKIKSRMTKGLKGPKGNKLKMTPSNRYQSLAAITPVTSVA
ncbi:ATP-dependent RNA helicase ddx51 [Halocaridina rubra]|uniref:ATP-dependent RNA helicase n=1 Tax=Halocaridina rubra TaxID=373956 RepID=A0AAN8WUN2_HALRR